MRVQDIYPIVHKKGKEMEGFCYSLSFTVFVGGFTKIDKQK